MVNIVITSYGTLGDNLPYVALGQALKARGHWVCMAISEPMHSFALKAGLEAVPVGRPALGPLEAQRHAKLWNHFLGSRPEEGELGQLVWAQITNSLPYVLEACQDADLLISSLQQDAVAAIVSEKTATPWIRAAITPFFLCYPGGKTKHPAAAANSSPEKSPESNLYKEKVLQDIRLQQGLPETPRNGWQSYGNLNRLILGASRHFCQLSPVFSPATQTGFWFYEDSDWSNWQPDDNLRKFVEQEPKPLVFSFSSMPLENPQKVLAVHVRAAAKLGRRILIHQGWAGFNESHLPSDINRDKVMFVGFIPQDWLFYCAAALIHHGGIGTTARALRNGCPMLIEPYGHDQFFNARQIVLLGVGAAMHPEMLTADELAHVLQEKVLTPDYKRRVIEVSEKIRAEQGLITTCDLIENWL